MEISSEYLSDFIRGVVGKLKIEDFEFSVEANGLFWDVYRFTTERNERPLLSEREGMVAVRMVDGHAEIGFFRFGLSTPENIAFYLTAN